MKSVFEGSDDFLSLSLSDGLLALDLTLVHVGSASMIADMAGGRPLGSTRARLGIAVLNSD